MYKWPVSDVNDINIIFFIYWPLFIQAKNVIETQGLSYKRDLFWRPGGGHYRKLQTNKAYRHEGTLYIEVWHIETCIDRLLSYPCRNLNQSSYFCTWDLYASQTKLSEHQWTALFGNWDPPPKKKFSLHSCSTRFSTGWQCGPFVLCGDSPPAGLTQHIQYELLCALVVGQWNLRIRLVLPVGGQTALVTGFHCKVYSETSALVFSVSVLHPEILCLDQNQEA